MADCLRSEKLVAAPIGIEETTFLIVDRLKARLPRLALRNANAIVRGCRMFKWPTEIALMQAATDITIAAIRDAHAALREGMSPSDISALLKTGMTARGGTDAWALVLLGEGSAYPHGSGKPQAVRRGEVVLIDTGCAVRGYQSDVSPASCLESQRRQRRVWKGRTGHALPSSGADGVRGSVDDAVR